MRKTEKIFLQIVNRKYFISWEMIYDKQQPFLTLI